jgi:hypothetical protein
LVVPVGHAEAVGPAQTSRAAKDCQKAPCSIRRRDPDYRVTAWLTCSSSSQRRAHAAEEVYVTGTFDNWSKSEQLEKVGNIFEKNVTLSDASEKIYYKVG